MHRTGARCHVPAAAADGRHHGTAKRTEGYRRPCSSSVSGRHTLSGMTCSLSLRTTNGPVTRSPAGSSPSGRMIPRRVMAGAGESQAVARPVAEIGMYRPATQHPFLQKPSFLHNARRCAVLDVARCPDPPDRRLRRCPVHDHPQSFAHQAMAHARRASTMRNSSRRGVIRRRSNAPCSVPSFRLVRAYARKRSTGVATQPAR